MHIESRWTWICSGCIALGIVLYPRSSIMPPPLSFENKGRSIFFYFYTLRCNSPNTKASSNSILSILGELCRGGTGGFYTYLLGGLSAFWNTQKDLLIQPPWAQKKHRASFFCLIGKGSYSSPVIFSWYLDFNVIIKLWYGKKDLLKFYK